MSENKELETAIAEEMETKEAKIVEMTQHVKEQKPAEETKIKSKAQKEEEERARKKAEEQAEANRRSYMKFLTKQLEVMRLEHETLKLELEIHDMRNRKTGIVKQLEAEIEKAKKEEELKKSKIEIVQPGNAGLIK